MAPNCTDNFIQFTDKDRLEFQCLLIRVSHWPRHKFLISPPSTIPKLHFILIKVITNTAPNYLHYYHPIQPTGAPKPPIAVVPVSLRASVRHSLTAR